ncbi:hypothetical protein BRC83_02625 [Halobacteriales archaeon QS_1_68_17]|nr:MAG: hypothetical protein BRC83_02625 [Halobacteriales archaeon QS_1_68_17]
MSDGRPAYAPAFRLAIAALLWGGVAAAALDIPGHGEGHGLVSDPTGLAVLVLLCVVAVYFTVVALPPVERLVTR